MNIVKKVPANEYRGIPYAQKILFLSTFYDYGFRYYAT